MEKLSLKILDGKGLIYDCIMQISYKEDQVFLSYYDELISLEVNSSFPFMALVDIRNELEKLDKKIMCKGSRIDVYPSGMSMVGRNAYILRQGKQALTDDIVDIFDEELDLGLISSVKEQLEYRNNWIRSFTKNAKILEYLDRKNK